MLRQMTATGSQGTATQYAHGASILEFTIVSRSHVVIAGELRIVLASSVQTVELRRAVRPQNALSTPCVA